MDIENAKRIVDYITDPNGGPHTKLAYPWGDEGGWRLDDTFTADQLEAICIVMRASARGHSAQ